MRVHSRDLIRITSHQGYQWRRSMTACARHGGQSRVERLRWRGGKKNLDRGEKEKYRERKCAYVSKRDKHIYCQRRSLSDFD